MEAEKPAVDKISNREERIEAYLKYIGEMLEYINKERLEHIDNRINNIKGWVTFIGIVVLLGLIVGFLSPLCR
jgi:hypothetical protein